MKKFKANICIYTILKEEVEAKTKNDAKTIVAKKLEKILGKEKVVKYFEDKIEVQCQLEEIDNEK